MRPFVRFCSAIGVLSLVACITTASAAEAGKPGWVKYWETDRATIYHWSATRTAGGSQTIWQLISLKKKDKSGFRSIRRLFEAYCSLGQFTTAQRSTHASPMGDGPVLDEGRYPESMEHPAPNTSDEYLFDMLCDKAGSPRSEAELERKEAEAQRKADEAQRRAEEYQRGKR